MEHGAIVPDRVPARMQWRVEYVGRYPRNERGASAKPFPRNRETSWSDVENSHRSIPDVEQPIDERRCTAADIDHRRLEVRRRTSDQFQ